MPFSDILENKIVYRLRDGYNNQRKNTNNEAERIIATGKVSNQAKRILLIVPAWRFLIPLLATIVPAIPEDNACVVLTGSLKNEAKPIVVAATSSAEAP